MNGDELSKAIDNIKSMKSLKRKGTHSWTVTPHVAITVNGQPNDNNRNPYFGIIFAYDSLEVDTILSHIQKLTVPSNLLPNAIVLYSKKTIIIHSNGESVEAFPCNDFDGYTALYCGDDTLAYFIGLLINYTRYTLLSAAEVPAQVNQALEKTLKENITNETLKVIGISAQEE